LVNLAEGLYCDMEEKTLMPVCTGALSETCFDVEQLGMKVQGVVTSFLNFAKIIEWGNGTDLADTGDRTVELSV